MVMSENFNPQNKVKKKKVSEVLFFILERSTLHIHTHKNHIKRTLNNTHCPCSYKKKSV